MGIDSVDSDAAGQAGPADTLEAQRALAAIVLRCVECNTLYPGFEITPRYRCDCGGVLDVEAPFHLPARLPSTPKAERDVTSSAGAPWRQLFDERAATPPIWPLSTSTLLPDRSGVWRYRELILPVPESVIVSRPEGNTGLYPVGMENCDDSRQGHRAIGQFAGL